MPPVSTVDVTRPELGGKAVAILVEDEQRMVADGLELAVVGRLLLRAVNRTLGAVDIESHAPGSRSGGRVPDKFRNEASDAMVAVLLGEDLGLEPVERRGEHDTGLPAPARGQHLKLRPSQLRTERNVAHKFRARRYGGWDPSSGGLAVQISRPIFG